MSDVPKVTYPKLVAAMLEEALPNLRVNIISQLVEKRMKKRERKEGAETSPRMDPDLGQKQSMSWENIRRINTFFFQEKSFFDIWTTVLQLWRTFFLIAYGCEESWKWNRFTYMRVIPSFMIEYLFWWQNENGFSVQCLTHCTWNAH